MLCPQQHILQVASQHKSHVISQACKHNISVPDCCLWDTSWKCGQWLAALVDTEVVLSSTKKVWGQYQSLVCSFITWNNFVF